MPFLSRAAVAVEDGPSAPEGNSSDNELNQPAAVIDASVAIDQSTVSQSTVSQSTINQSRLGALLDSAQGEVNPTLIEGVSFSPQSRSPLLSSHSTGQPLDDAALQEPQFSSAIAAVPADSDEAEADESMGFTIEVQAQADESQKLEDMEDFRRLVQEAQSQLPEPTSESASEIESDSATKVAQNENLPTLEEGTPSAPPVAPPSESAPPAESIPSAPVDAGVDDAVEGMDTDEDSNANEDTGIEESSETEDAAIAPIPAGTEINGVMNRLISDPNPLSFPVSRDEVEVDRSPVITLEEAIQLAYQNNQTLQSSILQLDQAEAALDEAKAALLPSATVQSTLRNQQSGGVEDTRLDTDFQVSYNLLTGGSRRASIRAAELQQQVSALAVEAQQEQLRLVTANLYYALQEAAEQIRINQSFVDEAARNLDDSELRQDVGVGTRFDVLRADVQLANAQQSLVQSQFNERIARRDIARLLNLPPTAGLETTPVVRAEDWPLDLEESILLAFQNRAELEQQLLQADISEEQRQIALAAVRPQLSLFATYGLDFTVDSDLPNGGDFGDLDDNTNFGLQLNWTLFDGGASRAAARQQEIAAKISEEQFSENLDQVRFDVEQAYFNIRANETNIDTSNGAVIQAEAALELANLRLQAGVGTQLDVLSAQTELTQAQVNNVTAILGYNRALVAIQRAISNLDL